VGGASTLSAVDFTEKEILIAEQLKAAGLKWTPRQGDYFADHGLRIQLVDKELADQLVHSEDPLEDRIWLPTWQQGRALLRKLGFVLRDHSEDLAVPPGGGPAEAYIGVAVESKQRGRHVAEGSSDLEALYGVVYRVLKSTKKETKAGLQKGGRAQGKVCAICQGIMVITEVSGAWYYVCSSCGHR